MTRAGFHPWTCPKIVTHRGSALAGATCRCVLYTYSCSTIYDLSSTFIEFEWVCHPPDFIPTRAGFHPLTESLRSLRSSLSVESPEHPVMCSMHQHPLFRVQNAPQRLRILLCQCACVDMWGNFHARPRSTTSQAAFVLVIACLSHMVMRSAPGLLVGRLYGASRNPPQRAPETRRTPHHRHGGTCVCPTAPCA